MIVPDILFLIILPSCQPFCALFLVAYAVPTCEAPTLSALGGNTNMLEGQWQTAASRLANQWENPNDVLTILLIIGGDIVQKAIAQLAADRFVPVAFSFGWVSYSFNTLLAVFGEGALMPTVVYPSTLINARSGYGRLNYSWVLNRLLHGVEQNLEPLDAALCVSVFRSRQHSAHASRDWIWWSGVITILIQLCVAIVPCALQSDWTIFLVTVAGAGLALSGGSLQQWRLEKWGARLDEKNTTFCLTRGNGFQHVLVIQNQAPGSLNLEDLAMPRRHGCSGSSKAAVTVLAVLWIVFLINVAGLRNNTWYLLGVGFIGMAQNMLVAAVPRQPEAMGLPLDLVTRIQGPKVMHVLVATERQFPLVGLALVKTFFPGGLNVTEEAYWATREREGRPLFGSGVPSAQPPDNLDSPRMFQQMNTESQGIPDSPQTATMTPELNSAQPIRALPSLVAFALARRHTQ